MRKKVFFILLFLSAIVIIGIILDAGILGNRNFAGLAVEETNTEKYFLSKVELIGNSYTPILIECFFDDKDKELYQQWSAIYYPSYPPYEVALVRVEFQREVFLDKTCFIKEVKTEGDWHEVKEKYGFSKERFGR